MKIRIDKDSNYRSVFLSNHKTIRSRIDVTKPIGTPRYPEILDVAINSKCLANCPYCYVSALKSGSNFSNIVSKAMDIWSELDSNSRPFQIAIGGAGEPTMHPDFTEFIKVVNELGILPNYTTNGMHLSNKILRATEEYCGGVAVSYHPHIDKVFHKAISQLKEIKTRLNTHIIVGQPGSLELLQSLYDKYYDEVIEYFVILPYQVAGRAKEVSDIESEYRRVLDWVSKVDSKKFAFGALFYDYLLRNESDLKLSIDIYEPEIYSGYIVMDDSYRDIRFSSYDNRVKLKL